MITTVRLWIIYTSTWLIWSALHAGIIYGMGVNLETAIADSLVNNLLLAFVLYVLSNMLRFYRPEKGNTLNLLPWALILSGLSLWATYAFLDFIFGSYDAYSLLLERSLLLRFCIAFLIVACFTLLSWIWYYVKTSQEDEKRKIILEKMLGEAELYKLRQQLQPHFLFNSLNSISALIGSRPVEARNMIQQLSDFLRGTVRSDEKKMIPLSEELEYLGLYLEIEKVRFGHRLNAIVEHDEASAKCLMPSLLLQPLLENAIKFGLYDTTEQVNIKIKVIKHADLLEISIENPFDPSTAQARQGTGFGLMSARKRLNLLYTRNDLLETEAKENIFITKIKIPC